VQVQEGEKRAWERVTGTGSYTTRETLHSQESKAEKAFQGPMKRQDEALNSWRPRQGSSWSTQGPTAPQPSCQPLLHAAPELQQPLRRATCRSDWVAYSNDTL
jgi:hypothetical protein